MSVINFIKALWAKPPSRGTPTSAGLDLFISPEAEVFELEPGRMAAFSTGLRMEIPEGTFGLIQSRSSAFRSGLWIHGVIDEDYRGEIILQIRNIGASPVRIEPGRAYAQLIIVPCQCRIPMPALTLSDTARGEGGFGSTGNT